MYWSHRIPVFQEIPIPSVVRGWGGGGAVWIFSGTAQCDKRGPQLDCTLLSDMTVFVSVFQVLLQYPKLKILYLHSNSIEKLSEIDKLAALPELISITLHGNPIESIPGYKNHIISTLPKLKTMDFIPITNQNRTDAQAWREKFRKK